MIADAYEKVANYYEPLRDGDVHLPEIPEGSHPRITVKMVYKYLCKMKSNTATVHNDIPAKIIKKICKILVLPFVSYYKHPVEKR